MKMKNLVTILILIFAFQGVDAQVVQIGSGTNINTITEASPVNIYYRRQVSQFVYTAAEINAAGGNGPNTLSQLGFYITNQPIYAIPGYTIKIKQTSSTNLNNALGTTGWTTVKNSFAYSPTPGGYDMILFDSPFNWDGTQNIGIEICWSQVQPNWNSSGQLRTYTSSGGYSFLRDDNTGSLCGSVPSSLVNTKPQVQLIFKTTTIWNGSVSTDWFNNSNWDAGTPDSDLDAVIPASASNMPSITAVGAECKNLDINASASLTLSGSNGIDIHADWTNNGTFNGNSGTVTMKGALAGNNIYGANNQRLTNLTIDNVNGATIASGSLEITGTLDVGIASGNFNTNNALTIVSNASGTGRINELTYKCKYTLDMSDNYGDSWNGGFITVLVDGVSVGDFTAKGSNSTDNFYAPNGATLQIQYTSGLYENENSYILYDGSNNNLFSDGPTPATGTVFTANSNCSFFNPINGDITMQRYVGSESANWKYLTSAVSGTTIADFNDDFFTTGFTGANDPPAVNSWASIYTYDETQVGLIDSGFNAATNVTNTIAVGQGFWAYIDEGAAYTIDVVGPPNVGNINLPVSYTNTGIPSADGWTMVGNPYPSSIDWDSPSITKTNVNAAIYIWNATQQQFASYIFPFGTNGGNSQIASTQAFWMQSNASGASVQLTEACKVSADATFLKQNTGSPLRIKSQNNNGSDELIINFEANATNAFDINYDAKKINSTNLSLPAISSLANGIDCSINQLNPQEINIPIKILSGVSGVQNITIENASLFSDVSCLILEDVFNNTYYDLSSVSSFSTYIYDTTQTARFLLHIGAPVQIKTEDISCFGNNDAKIVYSKNSTTAFDIFWKNSSNSIISSNTNVLISDSIINLTPGNYYIETSDPLCGNSTDTITIIEPSEITAAFVSNTDTVSIALGGNIDFTNQSNNATNYYWDFGDLNSTTITSPSHQYTQPGTYNVELNAYQNLNCYANKLATIIVIGDIITNIVEKTDSDYLKVWTNNNQLIIDGVNIDFIEVKNILGQTLIKTAVNQERKTIINLNEIKSQILIVTTFVENIKVSSKINFIKK